MIQINNWQNFYYNYTKENYYHTIQQNHAISSKGNILFSILSLLIAGIVFLVFEIAKDIYIFDSSGCFLSNWFGTVLYILVGISAILLLLSFSLYMRMFFGYIYSKTRESQNIYNDWIEYLAEVEKQDVNASDIELLNMCYIQITERLSEDAKINEKMNEKKSERMRRLITSLFVTGLTLFSTIAYASIINLIGVC